MVEEYLFRAEYLEVSRREIEGRVIVVSVGRDNSAFVRIENFDDSRGRITAKYVDMDREFS